MIARRKFVAILLFVFLFGIMGLTRMLLVAPLDDDDAPPSPPARAPVFDAEPPVAEAEPPVAEAEPPEATIPLEVAPAPIPWNFQHRGSGSYAVLKVNGRPIEFVHPLLTSPKRKGKAKGIHPSQLKIQPLLPSLESTDGPVKGKKAYLDVGARMFPGSTMWFMRHYPTAREFHATMFELLDLESTYDPAKPFFKGGFKYVRKAAWTHNDGVLIKGMRMARVADGVVTHKGDNRNEWLSPSVDLAEYIIREFKPEDFVVLKMDIEGGEWTVIPHLIRTGAIKLVDELFLECHPFNFDDYVKEPGRLPQVCIDLINDLRSMGVYCHRWF